MASNRKPLMLESMLLDVATSIELETFNRLMSSKRKGAAVCYGMRILRKHWAILINSKIEMDAVIVRENEKIESGKSALQAQDDDFFIPRINL